MSGTGTLWLHVGTHKTGTTSIQKALELSAGALAEAGIALWTRNGCNAWALANLFIRPELHTTPRLKLGASLPNPDLWDTMNTEIAQARGAHADMIISSEEFCLLRKSEEALALRQFFEPLFADIIPIIVLRAEQDWRSSRTDQLRKSGLWDYQNALPDAHSNNGGWYYDRPGLLHFWEQIAPPVVMDYDEECARCGSVLPGFARRIGQQGMFDGYDLRLNKRSRS